MDAIQLTIAQFLAGVVERQMTERMRRLAVATADRLDFLEKQVGGPSEKLGEAPSVKTSEKQPEKSDLPFPLTTLPGEIQRKIWRHAVPDPRVFVVGLSSDDKYHTFFLRDNKKTGFPSPQRVCATGRDESLKILQKVIHGRPILFNIEQDILYLPSSELEDLAVLSQRVDCGAIRSLAMGTAPFGTERKIEKTTGLLNRQFPNLTALYIYECRPLGTEAVASIMEDCRRVGKCNVCLAMEAQHPRTPTTSLHEWKDVKGATLAAFATLGVVVDVAQPPARNWTLDVQDWPSAAPPLPGSGIVGNRPPPRFNWEGNTIGGWV